MTDDEITKLVTAALNRRHPRATDVAVVSMYRDFFDGYLATLTFTSAGQPTQSSVYLASEDESYVFADTEQLAAFISSRQRHKTVATLFRELLSEILSVGGVAGIVALIIAGTISACLIKNPAAKLPPELWQALLAILGFYFGTKTGKHK